MGLKQSFFIFIYLYIVKTNVTGLADETADVYFHFSVHLTSRALERVKILVGIRAAHTLLNLSNIPWIEQLVVIILHRIHYFL